MTSRVVRIEEACRIILGNKLAESIINDQGLHWAIVAAVAESKTDDDPQALAALDKWLAEQRSKQ